jgi:hypothetical protein
MVVEDSENKNSRIISGLSVVLTIINLIIVCKWEFNDRTMMALFITGIPSFIMYYITGNFRLIFRISAVVGKIAGTITRIFCIPCYFIGVGGMIYLILGPIVHAVAFLTVFVTALSMPALILPLTDRIRRWLDAAEAKNMQEA